MRVTIFVTAIVVSMLVVAAPRAWRLVPLGFDHRSRLSRCGFASSGRNLGIPEPPFSPNGEGLAHTAERNRIRLVAPPYSVQPTGDLAPTGADLVHPVQSLPSASAQADQRVSNCASRAVRIARP